MLSWSISSHFVAIVRCIQKLWKILVGSRSFTVIDVDKSKKPVTRAVMINDVMMLR